MKTLYRKHKLVLSFFFLLVILYPAGCGSEFGVLLDDDAFLMHNRGNDGDELRIIWTEDTGAIRITNSSRTIENTILITAGTPLDIDLHVPEQKIYWTEDTLVDYQIKYVNIDGTEPAVFLDEDTYAPDHGPTEIAIDSSEGVLYWNSYDSLSGHNNIFRSPLVLSSPIEWVVDNNDIDENYTFDIDLDTINRKIYFSANTYWNITTEIGSGQTGHIYIADMNSANLDKMVDPEATGPTVPSMPLRGITVDGTGGHVFYVIKESENAIIKRSDLLFDDSEDWITADGFDIHKLALDLQEQKIYWTSPSNNRIYRADLDQPESGVEMFLELTGAPTGIVIMN